MSGPKRASGPRSNMYSKSKCSNWALFDPFSSEAHHISESIKPSAIMETVSNQIIEFYQLPLARDFVRPFSIEDIRKVLIDVPVNYLDGLSAIILLGGSTKQFRSRHLYRYGMYSAGIIYLCPIPKKLLIHRFKRPPKPNVTREYTRFGASIIQSNGEWVIRFTSESLRLFYLYDVLLHEIGHHIERWKRSPRSTCETFAKWYAEHQSNILLHKK